MNDPLTKRKLYYHRSSLSRIDIGVGRWGLEVLRHPRYNYSHVVYKMPVKFNYKYRIRPNFRDAQFSWIAIFIHFADHGSTVGHAYFILTTLLDRMCTRANL